MKLHTPLQIVFYFCFVSIIFSSCNSGIDLSKLDDNSVSFDESLVAPVGESSITVKDLFDKIGIPANVDTLKSKISFTWNYANNIKFPEFKFANEIPFKIYKYGGPFIIDQGHSAISFGEYLDLGYNKDSNGDEIDSLIVNSTTILATVEVPNSMKNLDPKNVNIEFAFDPQYLKVKDGSTLSFSPVQFGANNVTSKTLGEYKINFKLNNTLLSQIPYTVKIKVNNMAAGDNYILTSSDSIRITIKFGDINYKVAYGHLKLTGNNVAVQEIPFNISDYIPAGLLRFINPQVSLKASSTAGANFNFNLQSLKAVYSATGDEANMTFNGSNSLALAIKGPTVFGNEVVTQVPLFDNSNGTLDKFFDKAPYPDKFSYSYTYSNTGTNRTIDFLSPQSVIRYDVNVKIPIQLKGGSWYVVSGSIQDINFADLLNNVDSAYMILRVSNALPFRAKYRMTLFSSAVDSIAAVPGSDKLVTASSDYGFITSPYQIDMPNVDTSGNVVLPVTAQTIKIKLDSVQIDMLKKTKHIIYYLYLDNQSASGTPQPTNFTTTNTFGTKIGILFNKRIESKPSN